MICQQNSSCAKQVHTTYPSSCTFPILDPQHRDVVPPLLPLCRAKKTRSSRPRNMPDKKIVSTLTAWLKEVTHQNGFIASILEFDVDCANSARQREDFGSRCVYISMRQLGYAGFFQRKSDFQGKGPSAHR